MKNAKLNDHFSATDLAIHFTLWAQGRTTAPHYEDVMAQFGCSRATAYRLLSKWYAAKGEAPPAARRGRSNGGEWTEARRQAHSARMASRNLHRRGDKHPWRSQA